MGTNDALHTEPTGYVPERKMGPGYYDDCEYAVESRTPAIRTFTTGATRDADDSKNDYEGFLSPLVIEAYGDYMTEHRRQSDGALRASDNWQKGIPRDQYMKSLLRHIVTAWKLHRGWTVREEKIGGELRIPTMQETLCAILFNAMGYLHEILIPPRP